MLLSQEGFPFAPKLPTEYLSYLLITGQIMAVGTICTKSSRISSCVNVVILSVSNTVFSICSSLHTRGKKPNCLAGRTKVYSNKSAEIQGKRLH